MIQFQCGCGKALQARPEHAGLQVSCPSCNSPLLVPGAPAHAYRAEPPQSALAPERGLGHPGSPPRHRREAPVSSKAVASLILGAATFLVPVLLAIPAVVFGILARRDIRQSRGAVSGGGMAVGGIVCGVVGNVSLLIVWFVYGAIREGDLRREEQAAKTQAQNNLKQIGLAMHNYHDVHNHLPASAITSPDGKPLLSWRVAILPYIEQGAQDALYKQFRLNEPWDSPHNIKLLDQMPTIYAPTKGKTAQPHATYLQIFTGPKTPFPDPRTKRRFTEFLDGTSNTILVAEGAEAVPWTKPDDLAVVPGGPLPRLGGPWQGGCYVGMADGSVRWVHLTRVSERTLRIAIDPADATPFPPDWD